MLIYMAPCGIGLGHAARTAALARHLIKRGHKVVFSTYGDAVDFIKRKGYNILIGHSLKYEVDEKGRLSLKNTIARGPKTLYNFSRQIGDELYFMGVLEPDIVISDSRLSTSISAMFWGIPSYLIINQLLIILPLKFKKSYGKTAKSFFEKLLYNIMSKIWERSEKIVVPDFPPPYTISQRNLILTEKYKKGIFIGPIVEVFPNEVEDRANIRRKLNLSDKDKLILVNPSGTKSEKKAYIEMLIKLIRKSEFQNVFFIISKGDPSNNSPPISIDENIKVYSWIENKFELLKASDLIISHGGHTTIAEAMYYGVPIVLTPSSSHTERYNNAISVEKMGIGRKIIWEEINIEIFRKTIKEVLNNSIYRYNSKKIAEYCNEFKGINKIIDIIESSGE